jgi:hypothetical protein
VARQIDGLEKGVKTAKAVESIEKGVARVAKVEGRVFTQTAKDGDLMFFPTKIGDDAIEFAGNFSQCNGTLTIKNFAVDGALTNELGVLGVKSLISDFGRQQGVNKVIIEGTPRTTGAKPGKITELIFDVK